MEIKQMYNEARAKTIAVLPFAHLSMNLASSKNVINFFDLLEKQFQNYDFLRGHFGSDKSLLLNIHGHKGNVRYREF